jgi:hypothetical protein
MATFHWSRGQSLTVLPLCPGHPSALPLPAHAIFYCARVSRCWFGDSEMVASAHREPGNRIDREPFFLRQQASLFGWPRC